MPGIVEDRVLRYVPVQLEVLAATRKTSTQVFDFVSDMLCTEYVAGGIVPRADGSITRSAGSPSRRPATTRVRRPGRPARVGHVRVGHRQTPVAPIPRFLVTRRQPGCGCFVMPRGAKPLKKETPNVFDHRLSGRRGRRCRRRPGPRRVRHPVGARRHLPDLAFDAAGIIDDVVEDLGLLSLGRIDQKGAASLSPDAKYNEIMGYGALAPRRRILQSEGMAIAIQPQEARKITHRIQSNLDAGAFVGTSTGGFRAKKTAGIPPKYWSILLLGLDFQRPDRQRGAPVVVLPQDRVRTREARSACPRMRR